MDYMYINNLIVEHPIHKTTAACQHTTLCTTHELKYNGNYYYYHYNAHAAEVDALAALILFW